MTTVTPHIGRGRRLALGLFITSLVLTGAATLGGVLYLLYRIPQ